MVGHAMLGRFLQARNWDDGSVPESFRKKL